MQVPCRSAGTCRRSRAGPPAERLIAVDIDGADGVCRRRSPSTAPDATSPRRSNRTRATLLGARPVPPCQPPVSSFAKGRKAPRKKVATPVLKSGQGRKARIATRSAAASADLHGDAEAELGAARGRPRAADEQDGGHPLHPEQGHNLRSTRSCCSPAAGSARRPLQGRPRHPRCLRRRRASSPAPSTSRPPGFVRRNRATAACAPDSRFHRRLVQHGDQQGDARRQEVDRRADHLRRARRVVGERTGHAPRPTSSTTRSASSPRCSR